MSLGLRRAAATPAEPRMSARPAPAAATVTRTASRDHDLPVVVVAGPPRGGKSTVIAALLGPTASAPHPATDAAAAGPRVAIGPWVNTPFRVYRNGPRSAAMAYVPGHREPRPVQPDLLAPGAGAAARSRPPRRVEVRHPGELLNHLILVDPPASGDLDASHTELVCSAVAGDGRLLFVADAAGELEMAELDFLAAAERRGVDVIFVLSKIDEYPAWPAVLAANQALVHRHAPRFATAPWFAVDSRAAGGTADQPAIEEAALGLAGVGVAALHTALRRTAEQIADRRGEPEPRRVPRPVAATAHDIWQEVLAREVEVRKGQVLQQLRMDLLAVRQAGGGPLAHRLGCSLVPQALDRELHALSVRTTRAVEAAAGEVIARVFDAILTTSPDTDVVNRVKAAARNVVLSAEPALEWERALLVTATAGVATVAGPGALASLSAVPPQRRPGATLPPLGAAVTTGGYSRWRRNGEGDADHCRRWLERAVEAVGIALSAEVEARFAALGEALGAVANDAVEHGVLLA